MHAQCVRKKRRLNFLGLALLGVALTCLVVCWNQWLQRRSPNPKENARIKVARLVDLGEIDLYKTIDHRFAVANNGGQTLFLKEARSSCQCQGVYAKTSAGLVVSPAGLSIEPGDEVQLGIAFVASGLIGQPTQVKVAISTNDTEEPEAVVAIRFTPIARLYSVPQTIVFGEFEIGKPESVLVDIFADDTHNADWKNITCEPNDRYSVAFRRATIADAKRLGNSVASYIGALEVVAKGRAAEGEFEEMLSIQGSSKELLRIPIAGRAMAFARVVPDTLVLPKRTGTACSYAATVLVVGQRQRPFAIRMQEKSPTLAVQMPQMENRVSHAVAIKYVGDRPSNGKSVAYVELLAIKEDGEEVRCRLRVTVNPEKQ